MRKRRNALLALLTLVLLPCSPAWAQDWARKMFEVTSHDFGTVAKNSLTEFEFKLKNIYVPNVHISSVSTSCGCTTPRIAKHTLATYEQGAIIAHFNTDRFTGQRNATLTVTFDRPYHTTVQLHVRGNIREDVVLSPGSVQLGAVRQGTEIEKTIEVQCPGYRSWRITGVQSGSPHLSGQAFESRDRYGRTTYQLRVRLAKDAPAGYIRDHLVLTTNDYQRTNIPVLVEGRIQSSITISPGTVFLGVMRPGQEVRKTLVVRSSSPLRITDISADQGQFQFSVPTKDQPSTMHVIQATFIAPQAVGKLDRTIRIDTDTGGSVSRKCTGMMAAEEAVPASMKTVQASAAK